MRPQRSDKAKFDAEGFELVKADLSTILRTIANASSVALTGVYHQVIPVSGTADVYVTPTVTTTGSGGGNKHVVSALWNGQSPSTITADTSVAEFKAYSRVYLGQYTVAAGDVISTKIVTTGAPTSCTLSDLVLSIQLTPTVSIQ